MQRKEQFRRGIELHLETTPTKRSVKFPFFLGKTTHCPAMGGWLSFKVAFNETRVVTHDDAQNTSEVTILSNTFGEKILRIRKAEGLSRAEFAELTGISPNTIQNFEIKGRDITSANLAKIVNHERFFKYTMWLMTGELIKNAGQIAPAD